eukprot:CAMPEP_0179837902 /NCGR_PEP_ID=MMETSP0982-20121206/336_1 /TAXON_ID=483367 /ORGANISM="non described non described, Strain CCMP 2436" /LENGTH=275 /DNA_ID=CAMNT_0021721129 /DNA_START=81 /DNA_END=909 /DNA_ORIENTATION=+
MRLHCLQSQTPEREENKSVDGGSAVPAVSTEVGDGLGRERFQARLDTPFTSRGRATAFSSYLDQRLLESVERRREDALTGHERLQAEAQPADHREAAVLELGIGVGRVDAILGKAERVEANVSRRATLPLVAGLRLDEGDDADDLEHAEDGHGAKGRDRVGAVEVALGVGPAIGLLHYVAEGREHADAAVLELNGAEAVDVLARRVVEGVVDATGLEEAADDTAVVRRALGGLLDGSGLLGGHHGRRRGAARGEAGALEGDRRIGQGGEHLASLA